jgi:hypothetical protein
VRCRDGDFHHGLVGCTSVARCGRGGRRGVNNP